MDAITDYLRDASPLTFFGINAAISALAVIPGGASGVVTTLSAFVAFATLCITPTSLFHF